MKQSDLDALMEKYRQPAIMLHRPYPPGHFPKTSSHLGGLPELPSGSDWPCTSDGTPLHFLAQIDCADLPSVEQILPKDGVLFFFARVDAEMIWGEGDPSDDCRVIFAPKAGAFPAAAPADLPSIMGGYTTFEEHFKLPDEPPFALYPRWPIIANKIQSWPDRSALQDLLEEDSKEYQKAVERARAAEALRVTGVPPIQEISTHWGKELHYGKEHPGAVTSGIEQPFPQVWVIIDRVARYLGNWANTRKEREFKEPSSYYNIDQLREIYRASLGWIRAAGQRGLESVPRAEERSFFVKWLLTLYGDDSIHISSSVGEALSAGIESAVKYAAGSPEAAALIPSRYFDELEKKHVPISMQRLGDLERWRVRPRYHQMLGNAGSSQQARSVERDDILLLQLISDYGVDFMFCDCGEAEFWISKQDLAARRFDKVWASACGG